jgi:hypothetical protein
MKRQRSLTTWGVALVSGLHASCEVPTTQLLVGVDTELAWGAGGAIQSVTLEVRRGDGSGPLRSRRTTALGAGAGRQSLPLWVTVASADDSDSSPVWVEALGCATADGCTRDTAVVAQRASVRFIHGEVGVVRLLLAAACVSRRCALTERCAVSTGRCIEGDTQSEVERYGGTLSASWVDASAGETWTSDVSVLDVAADMSPVQDGGDVTDVADLFDASDAAVEHDAFIAPDAVDARELLDVADVVDVVDVVDVRDVPATPIDVGVPDVGAPDVGVPDVGPTPCSSAPTTCACSTANLGGFCRPGQACVAGACVAATLQGSLVITEIMNDPMSVTDDLGEWVEVYNPGATPLDLRGLRISNSRMESVTVTSASPMLIAPMSYAVFSRNGNASSNGGVTVLYAFTVTAGVLSFGNSSTDTVVLDLGGSTIEIDRVTFDGTTGSLWPRSSGRAKSLRPTSLNATDNDQPVSWCNAPARWSPMMMGDYGSPGAPNPPCP